MPTPLGLVITRVTGSGGFAGAFVGDEGLASRQRDKSDIEDLIGILGIKDVAGVLAVCQQVFPGEPIPQRAYPLLRELLPDDQTLL